jgi:hypothetical protein
MTRPAVVRGTRAGPYSFAVSKGGKVFDLLLYGQAGLFPLLDYEVHWLGCIRGELLLLAIVEDDGVVVSQEFILYLNLRREYAWKQGKHGSD